jgi:hypothetical protein
MIRDQHLLHALIPEPARAVWLYVSAKFERFEAFPVWAKLGVITAAYILAIISSFGIVTVHVMLTSGPDRDASSGMYGFGDFMLFLLAFGAISLLPTAVSLLLMRRSRVFWSICSMAALTIAAVCLISEVAWFLHRYLQPTDMKINMWEALTVPVFFCSPFLFFTFGLATLAASRIFKFLLSLATAVEGVCIIGAVVWFSRAILHPYP